MHAPNCLVKILLFSSPFVHTNGVLKEEEEEDVFFFILLNWSAIDAHSCMCRTNKQVFTESGRQLNSYVNRPFCCMLRYSIYLEDLLNPAKNNLAFTWNRESSIQRSAFGVGINKLIAYTKFEIENKESIWIVVSKLTIGLAFSCLQWYFPYETFTSPVEQIILLVFHIANDCVNQNRSFRHGTCRAAKTNARAHKCHCVIFTFGSVFVLFRNAAKSSWQFETILAVVETFSIAKIINKMLKQYIVVVWNCFQWFFLQALFSIQIVFFLFFF